MSVRSSEPWLQVEQVDGATIVHLLQRELFNEEAIDCMGEQLRDLVERQGMRRLALHFGAVERMSSHMLGELIVLHKKVVAAGGMLVLCAFTPELRETFELLKLDRVFSIRATEQEAVQALRDS
jgi:anti-sigma B factor antagonist